MKRLNNKVIISGLAVFLVVGFVFSTSVFAVGPTKVNLYTADNFAVLAGSTITNTGTTVINGNVGLSPGTSITGFLPGIINGTQYVANTTATTAQTNLTTAYTDAAGRTPVTTVPTELGGTSLVAGVYDSVDGTFGITGTLTVDAAGDPNAVFIFKTDSTLTTAGASVVSLINGAQSCNVFWQVGSSATLGSSSVFRGNILAFTSITLTTGASIIGSALARNGAVTLDTNVITNEACADDDTSTPGDSDGGSGATDSPSLPNTGLFSTATIAWASIVLVGSLIAIAVAVSAYKKRAS